MNEGLRVHWINKRPTQRLIVTCALLSFVSVCANTPQTLSQLKLLSELTFIVDIIVGFVLVIEMLIKIYHKGLVRGNTAYFKNFSCISDCNDTLFIWVSVLIQATEMLTHNHDVSHTDNTSKIVFGLLRVPRALIMIRVFRYFLSSASGQMTAIVLRASQHIAGVSLFLVFFILLYGILGVQCFGDKTYHCVTKDTNSSHVTLSNLAIPDTVCSQNDDSMCPPELVCKDIHLTMEQRGYGSFDNIVISIKTVYEAASQEGWVFLMYKSIDTYDDWLGYFYFISLIFFLAWLVKNVFIAVIIDSFAEIRVQLHNLWGNSSTGQSASATQVLSTDGNSWQLVATEDVRPYNEIFETWHAALLSRYFHIIMQVAIILNVGILAFQPRLNQLGDQVTCGRNWNFFSGAELFFTIIFDLEALMKICCMGLHGYFMRSTYRYEAFLALVTTINTIKSVTFLRSFSVLRIIRLVKLSPTLEGFVYKILGPAKKIGALISFTFSIVTLTSCLSLQMFCHLGASTHFGTFPSAFMSMFQILTQEGWIDVMQDTMKAVSPEVRPFVTIYFILYHFFATTVLISLFVAVILDNLELDENVKRFKQLKLNEQSVDTKQKLPWRLRVFGHFPNRPQMVGLSSNLPGEFQRPRIRESYMRQFLDSSHSAVGVGQSPILNNNKSIPKTDSNMSLAFKVTESSHLGAAVLSGLDVQLAGGVAMSKENKRHVTNVIIKKRWDRSVSLRRRLIASNIGNTKSLVGINLEQVSKEEKYALSILSQSSMKPNMISFIMNNCQDHRRYISMDGRLNEGSWHPLLKPGHWLRQQRPSLRTGRVTFPDETRQSGIENLNMFQKHPQQEIDFKVIHLKRQEAMLKRERQERELRENHPLFDTPLLLVSRESSIRRLCHMIVYAQYKKSNIQAGKAKKQIVHFIMNLLGLVTYLEWIMILVTVGSCMFMLTETPTKRIDNTPKLLYAEYAFVICMSIELLLKLAVGGLFFTPKPILKDFGGIMDCFIYLISLIVVCTTSPNQFVPAQSGAQLLLVLRCLRPLRIFRLVPQIRKVVMELFRSFKDILMVSILLIALVFVFASFGVQMYGGELAACNDPGIDRREDCYGIFFQQVWISNSLDIEDDDPPGFMVPRVWTNPRNFDFDTISSAMLTLFEVLSLKGWVEVRDILIKRKGMIFQQLWYCLIDFIDVFSPLQVVLWLIHGLYIHIFIFLGSMVGLTLFIGVVVANYNENKGAALLTVDQRRWENLKCRLKIAQPLHLPPRPYGKGFRAKMYDLSQCKWFKRFITFCILAQSMLLSLKWAEEQEHVTVNYLAVSFIIFNGIFLLEIIIKCLGMKFMGMMRSWRNRYDALITFGGIVWIFAYFSLSDNATTYGAGAGLIILRFLSICGKHAILKMLLMTVAVSVYKSFFIIVAMFLLMLCYAFAGVVLFGSVKYGENIDRHANFGSAPLAIAVLFRIVTGEDWNKIMHDCMIQPPQCTRESDDSYWETDCGNFSAALMYFCSFYVIIAYIMLNLLVAIIMENFSLFYTMDEEILLSYNYLHMFQVTWNLIDVKQKGMIQVKHVKFLLQLLEGRLQIDPEKDHLLLKHMCYEMHLVGRHNAGHSGKSLDSNGSISRSGFEETAFMVSFHDVLMMLAYRSIDIRKSLQLEELLMREKREAEIEEAVAKMTICNFIYKCVVKNRQQNAEKQKSYQSNFLNRMNDVQTKEPSLVRLPNASDDQNTKEEQLDDTTSIGSSSDFNLGKGSKLRRSGIWRGPSSYFNGATLMTSSSLKPSIVESKDSVPHKTMNAVASWWQNIMVDEDEK